MVDVPLQDIIVIALHLDSFCQGLKLYYIPLEEGCVLGLPDEPRPHHDGLEDLPLDGPQLAVRRRLDRRRPLAVVQDGQLAEHLARRQDREELALAGHLHFAI